MSQEEDIYVDRKLVNYIPLYVSDTDFTEMPAVVYNFIAT